MTLLTIDLRKFTWAVEDFEEKQGRFVTLEDEGGGRVVFIGGPGQGGGGGAGGERVLPDRLYQRQGVTVAVYGDVDRDMENHIVNEAWARLPDWSREGVEFLEIHEESGYGFEAGEQQFQAGGDYSENRHRIRLYNVNAYREEDVDDMLYHEVGHNVFRKWGEDAYLQKERLYSSPELRNQLNPDGTPKLAFQTRFETEFGLFDAMLRWDQAWKAGEDGITNYSTAWAKEGYLIGSNETFAEMAKLYWGWGRAGLMMHTNDVGAKKVFDAFDRVVTYYKEGGYEGWWE